MKKILNIIVLIITIVVCIFTLTSGSCIILSEQSRILQDYEIAFTIGGFSFGGDWKLFKNNGERKYRLIHFLTKDFVDTTYDRTYQFEMDSNGFPLVKEFELKNLSIYNNRNSNKSELLIVSSFILKNSAGEKGHYFYDTKEYENKNHYVLSLKYNLDTYPIMDVTIDTVTTGKVSSKFYYKANYEALKDSSTDVNNSFNILVMGDGYATNTDIAEYQNYVETMFASSNKFMKNNMFKHFYNRTNIIRLDTISKESGVDTDPFKDSVRSILGYNRGNMLGMVSLPRVRSVINATKPKGIDIKWWGQTKADVIVILVNDPDTRSHGFFTTFLVPFSGCYTLGNKRSQQVNFVIINAATKSNGGINNTGALPHEMGHAVGCLWDEYTGDGGSLGPWIKFCVDAAAFWGADNPVKFKTPNIEVSSSISECKWYKLYQMGFDDNTFDQDIKLNLQEGAIYQTSGFYRPSVDSIMNRSANEFFNPIGAYHIAATIKMRIGDVTPDSQFFIPKSGSWEWRYYTYEDFAEEFGVGTSNEHLFK